MAKLSRNRVLACGLLSPLAALVLYVLVYSVLTRASTDLEKDWLFRLSISTAAMFLPFLLTVGLAITDHSKHQLSRSGKIGLLIATLSLGLALKPIDDGIKRWKQERNMALRGVAAPVFDTTDLSGAEQKLSDQKGKVVLINVWATWCAPCRAEMPKLDQLYQDKKNEGLMVFGLSDEDASVQRKYLERVPVTYPLLTVHGNIPTLYRDIARYPAIFLVDREGRLQPAPSPDKPFESLREAVTTVMGRSGQSAGGSDAGQHSYLQSK